MHLSCRLLPLDSRSQAESADSHSFTHSLDAWIPRTAGSSILSLALIPSREGEREKEAVECRRVYTDTKPDHLFCSSMSSGEADQREDASSGERIQQIEKAREIVRPSSCVSGTHALM